MQKLCKIYSPIFSSFNLCTAGSWQHIFQKKNRFQWCFFSSRNWKISPQYPVRSKNQSPNPANRFCAAHASLHWGHGAKAPRTHPQPAWNSSQRATSSSVWLVGLVTPYRQQSLRDICGKSYQVAPLKDKSSAQWEMPTYSFYAKDTQASAQTKWQDRTRPQIDVLSVAAVLLLASGFRSLWAAQRKSGCPQFSLLGCQHLLLSYYRLLKRSQLKHVCGCL